MHISDLTALHVLLLEKSLRDELIPIGDQGYYFAMAHRLPSTKVMESLAKGLHLRRLVKNPEVQVWPSYDVAADSLGFHRLYMEAIGTTA